MVREMHRYFLHVSYIGTQFRGVQKIFRRTEPNRPDTTTVQGVLEEALRKLWPVNEPQAVPSSRTDAGVHALHSTFHVDLQPRGNQPFDPNRVTATLNKFLNAGQFQLRVLQTVQVPSDVHCRHHATARTYTYRLCVICRDGHDNTHLCHVPIEEQARCHYICDSNFDCGKMIEVSKLFLGKHDFRTFMGRGSHYLDKTTRRTMQRAEVIGGAAALLFGRPADPGYSYWNVTFQSEGFLYNQVRRLVGTLIAVGQGRISAAQVRCMLQVPGRQSWDPRVVLAPSHGLYLCRVHYPHAIEALAAQ